MLNFFKKTKVENPETTVTQFLKSPSLKALEELKKTERLSSFDMHDNLNFGMYYTAAKFPEASGVISSNLKYSANIAELKQELEKREYVKSLIEPFVKGVHGLYMNVKIIYMRHLNDEIFIVLPWSEEGRINCYNQGDYDVVGVFPKYCDPTDESTREIKERIEQLERWQSGKEKFVPLPI